MNYENLTPIATSIGLGGITGYLLGYFIRKIIRIIFFAVGGILALLMYLQYQGVITVNMAKIQSYPDEIVNTLSNTNSTIESWNHIIPIGTTDLAKPNYLLIDEIDKMATVTRFLLSKAAVNWFIRTKIK